MAQVIVIGNCQAAPLAGVLRMLPGITASQSLAVHERGTPRYQQAETELRPLLDQPDTHIFTFPVSAKHGPYATEALRQRPGTLKTITNLHFAGLHPDITYLGGLGARLHSPLGDYHSRIVLDAFCAGRSKADCVALFNGAEYERRGYFQVFDQAAEGLRQRDAALDIRFADEFLGMLREQPALFTVNHPTSAVFQAFGAKLADSLGLALPRFPSAYLANPLAVAAWWPVYGEIAEAHRLAYRTPMAFRQAEARGGRLFTLAEFVQRSYMLYRKFGEALPAAWAAESQRPA